MKQVLLIIDDNEAILRLLTVLFSKKYTVMTASDAVEGISFLSKGLIPDLIISDLDMVNITGQELVRHLSTSAIYNKVPVILMTDNKMSDVDSLMDKSVVVSVIHKPFDPVALSRVVEYALLRNSLSKEIFIKSDEFLTRSFNQSFSNS